MDYNVQSESVKILERLARDERLSTPAEVLDRVPDVEFTGSSQPFLPVPWKFTEAMTALKGLEAAWGAVIANERGLQVGRPTVDTDHAALFLFSAALASINGKPTNHPDNLHAIKDWDLYDSLKIRYRQLATNIYKTGDGRYYHTHGSMNATPTREAIGLPPFETSSVTDQEALDSYAVAVAKCTAEALDKKINDEYRQAGTICYTVEESRATEQGQAIANCPIYELSRSPNAADQQDIPVPWIKTDTLQLPLQGIKVLELSRIIAAPAIGKGLAEYGADVLRITAPNLPDMHALHPDLSQGKLQAFLDLKTKAGKAKFEELLLEADVFIDGYRPGALARLGYSRDKIENLVKSRGRGIVIVRENTYGWHGPWQGRSGWQQISDCFTGISWGFGQMQGLDEPVVPIFPNSDYGTGVIGLIGVMHALYRRSREGGSYRLDVSLSYYNNWLASLGFYPDAVWQVARSTIAEKPLRHNHDMLNMLAQVLPPLLQARKDLMMNAKLWTSVHSPSFGGMVRLVSPVIKYENIQLGFVRPPSQNGSDPARFT